MEMLARVQQNMQGLTQIICAEAVASCYLNTGEIYSHPIFDGGVGVKASNYAGFTPTKPNTALRRPSGIPSVDDCGCIWPA